MSKRSYPVIMVCLTLCLMLTTLPAHAMRCGNALVNEGDSQAKVLKYCGEPTTKTSRYGLRPGTYPDEDNDAPLSAQRRYVYGSREVLVEEWTYNFGPNKLMRMVRFAGGVVEEVSTLGYGYHED